MKGYLKKIVLASFLSIVPLSVLVYSNFIHYRRGWHSMNIQFSTFFWFTRVLLTPLLVILALKLWQKANSPLKFVFYSAICFFLYTFLCWAISLTTCIWLAPGFDGRIKNLFNIIMSESSLLNLLVYIGIILLVFVWSYYDWYKTTQAENLVLEKQLAWTKSELANKQTNATDNSRVNKKSHTIAVKNGHKTVLIPVAEISYVQSKGAYINIVTANSNYLLKRTLSAFLKILPESFLRVHRSGILNMELVRELRSLPNGDAILVLKNEKEVRLSRTYREQVMSVLYKK